MTPNKPPVPCQVCGLMGTVDNIVRHRPLVRTEADVEVGMTRTLPVCDKCDAIAPSSRDWLPLRSWDSMSGPASLVDFCEEIWPPDQDHTL